MCPARHVCPSLAALAGTAAGLALWAGVAGAARAWSPVARRLPPGTPGTATSTVVALVSVDQAHAGQDGSSVAGLHGRCTPELFQALSRRAHPCVHLSWRGEHSAGKPFPRLVDPGLDDGDQVLLAEGAALAAECRAGLEPVEQVVQDLAIFRGQLGWQRSRAQAAQEGGRVERAALQRVERLLDGFERRGSVFREQSEIARGAGWRLAGTPRSSREAAARCSACCRARAFWGTLPPFHPDSFQGAWGLPWPGTAGKRPATGGAALAGPLPGRCAAMAPGAGAGERGGESTGPWLGIQYR